MGNENTQKMNGNYLLSRYNSWNYDIALIPEESDRLFDVNRDKSNVLIFIDKYSINNLKNIGMFLALNMARDPEFNVAISTNFDAKIAKDAEIIINLFDNDGFVKDLEKYDNGLKLFIKRNEINEIDSIKDFKYFIDKIKSGIVINKLDIKVKLEVKG